LCAKNLIAPDEAVLVLFGDDIVDNEGGKNSVQQLMEIYEKTGESTILLQKIDKKDSEKYGIVEISRDFQDSGEVLDVVEKPLPENAPSDLAIVGKYIITPQILQKLAELKPDKSGEIRLSAAFDEHLKDNGKLMGKVLDGKRFDIGDKLGFLEATLHFALKKEGNKAQQVIEKFARENG
jgi:UTP--glucose-1-phosphate uridylyltransferase